MNEGFETISGPFPSQDLQMLQRCTIYIENYPTEKLELL